MSAANVADFPADVTFTGTPQSPDFEGRDADYRNFRSRVANGLNAGANYAGYFTIVRICCGTSCMCCVVVDIGTGAVQNFHFGGEEFSGMSLHHFDQSRMIRLKWLSDWATPSCTEQDIVFNAESWEVIAERSSPALGETCA